MKIPAINLRKLQYLNKAQSNTTFEQNKFTQNSQTNLNNIPHYPMFKGNVDNYEAAKQYLETRTKRLKDLNVNPGIWAFDINKLEGIQKGIKVFEGLSMKEITFLLSTLTEVATLRGCYNNCAHCYGEAKPPIKETKDEISRMDWEDFTTLTNGIDELHNRLGFQIVPFDETIDYMTLFHDADCSQVYIKDKDGNIHDWEEMARRMYQTTGVQQLFDTGGLYLQDKEAQKRVEKYVKSISEGNDNDFLEVFNVSINPFHAMYFKSVNAMWDGDKEKELFFRKKDAQRMANVLFTVSPIARTGKLDVISRALAPETKNVKGLTSDDMLETYDRYYFRALKKLYTEDLNSEKKIIKKPNDIKFLTQKYRKIISDVSTNPTVTNKLKNLLTEKDYATKSTKSFLFNDPQKAINDYVLFTIIDANGDVYCTNFRETYKTDLKLNFKNKDKKTAPIKPTLNANPITKEFIKNICDQWADSAEPKYD